jgi:hypothetical protein
MLADWRNARTNPEGGGVAWLGGVEPVELGAFDGHLLESGRNAAAVDVARHASIPADLIDATVTESSLHYSTSRDNDRRLIDYGLGQLHGRAVRAAVPGRRHPARAAHRVRPRASGSRAPPRCPGRSRPRRPPA